MEGTRIGSYRLTRKLGEGGMGAVYLAESDSVATRKAVKVLLAELSADPSMMARFRFEAQAVADLQHDNIIAIDEFSQLPNGQWFIMMPFLEGSSLSGFLMSRGPLGMHLTVHILAQVGAALHAAHTQGFVHRDLKPENVFITSRHSNPHLVKLLDFGIAKNTRSTPNGQKTASGTILGTPVYMAAEQYEDAARVDARADIFSLGVLAYVMLSGTYPFGPPPDNLMDLYNRQRYESPAALPSHVPSRAQQAVYRALSYDRNARPQSAQEFVIELALATPDDPLEPSGVEIVRQVASELLLTGPASETTRNPHAAELARALWPRLGGTPAPALASVSPSVAIPAAPAHVPPSRATVDARSGASSAPNVYPMVTAEPSRTTLSSASGPVPVALPTAAPQRSRAPFIAAAAILIAAAVGITVLVVTRSTSDDTPASAAIARTDTATAPGVDVPPPPPTPAAAGVTPDAAPVATVSDSQARTIAIETIPAGADIVVDGKSLGESPASMQRVPGATVEIRATRRGFRSETRSFTVAADTTRFELRLTAKADSKSRGRPDPAPSASPAATAQPAPTPPAESSKSPPPDASTRRSTFNPNDVLGN